MTKEIIINASKSQTCIAILEDGELVELYLESPENVRTIGDIYLGRVRRIMPSIQAGFVDIGQKQDAFLHFSDVSDNLPELLKFVENPEPIGGGREADQQLEGEAESERKSRKRSGRSGRRGGKRGKRGSSGGKAEDASRQKEAGKNNGVPDGEDSSGRPESRSDQKSGRSGRSGSRSRRSDEGGDDATPRGEADASGGDPGGEGQKKGGSSRRRSSSRGRSGRGGRRGSRGGNGNGGGEAAQSGGTGRGKRSGDDSGDKGDKYVSFAAPPDTETEENLVDGPSVDPIESLQRDQKILVQITKEPISNKGSRITTGVTLAGRFMVLVPKATYVAVSKRIYSTKERRRLRTLARSLLPEGFGVIVRTVAEGKDAKALDTDLRLLLEKWRKIEDRLMEKPEPPCVIFQDVNMASSVIRDLFTDDYDRILVDDQRLYRNIKSYVQAVAPQMAAAVKLHEDRKPIFESVGIAKDIAAVFESRIDMPSGGYLFIEKTEAMYVIDVNSGRSGRGKTQEENSLKVNLDAARLLAKQLRLRDIGGIIVVDFIDLRDESNRRKVFEELRKAFRKDRAVTKVLPMSDFGLVQITRQRLKPSVSSGDVPKSVQDMELVELEESGGKLPETREVVELMERWLVLYSDQTKKRTVTLRVHPFLAAYLTRGVPNYPMKWFMRHFVRVRIEMDDQLDPFDFQFLKPDDGENITESFDYGPARDGA